MRYCLLEAPTGVPTPITVLEEAAFAAWRDQAAAHVRAWVDSIGFRAAKGKHCLIPAENGVLAAVVVGVSSRDDPWLLGALAKELPAGEYRLDGEWDTGTLERATLGFSLGAYGFDRYKKEEPSAQARLVVSEQCSAARILNLAQAIFLVRDLVNTPAQDMMPEDLASASVTLAGTFGAELREVVGPDLLEHNYPAIHTVGQASAHAPRLIDLTWGDAAHPKVTLVGKGVCFDSGGLDIKPAQGMRLMKKDMGGAAHALGLARMIMAAPLPVRLRVLIPAVENAIAGNAYRPGDVVRTRSGVTIEIDNTDAEGRVVLSDALAEADAAGPALIVDFATLTGAARVALGTELPGMFSSEQPVADAILAAAAKVSDPVWQLPLHSAYEKLIDSKIADISNSGATPYGGAITAALFLKRFVGRDTPWVHFDVMAWNTSTKPGRPEGGEAMGLRAVFDYLSTRFST